MKLSPIRFPLLFGMCFGANAQPLLAATCPFVPWTDYNGVQLSKLPDGGAYLYVVDRIAIDADGAPKAYHPKDIGLDKLANAGYPDRGWKDVLVPDPNSPSVPYIQADGGAAGFFVSKTSLEDATKKVTDISRYVDASEVSYVVFPGSFYSLKGSGSLGDVAVAGEITGGKFEAAIVGDVGPQHDPLGEISIALAERLSGNKVDARSGTGTPHERVVFVVFPHSHSTPSWPLSPDELNQIAARRVAAVGGWDGVLTCVRGALPPDRH
jgi:hypothetical protein